MMEKNRVASEITGPGRVRLDVPVPKEYQLCHDCERLKGDYRGITPTPKATQEELDAWIAYAARWTLTYPVKLELSPYVDGNGHLRIDFIYPEEKDARNPAELLDRSKSAGLLAPSHFPDGETPRWIRANVLYHLSHELDEWLKFDGQTVFDPHAEAHHLCEPCIKKWALEHPE